MTDTKNNVCQLVICMQCHERINIKVESYNRYNGKVYCNNCFIELLDNVDINNYEFGNVNIVSDIE